MSSVQGAKSATNAIQQWQYLQSLSMASASSSQPKKPGSASAQAFDPFAGLAAATQARAGNGSVPPFNLDNMNALINAQAQSSATGTSGLSHRQQQMFGRLDTDGDGTVTGAELQKDFGTDNKAIADFVMKKLDSNGDGAISQSEFAAGTTRSGHHHTHSGSAQRQDALAALFGATQGASSTSTGNSDGSSTTTITYADGSKVSMTSAASANSDNSSNANSSAKSNLLEQLIKLQAQLTQGAAASSSVATV
jgi:hypothetical protein